MSSYTHAAKFSTNPQNVFRASDLNSLSEKITADVSCDHRCKWLKVELDPDFKDPQTFRTEASKCRSTVSFCGIGLQRSLTFKRLNMICGDIDQTSMDTVDPPIPRIYGPNDQIQHCTASPPEPVALIFECAAWTKAVMSPGLALRDTNR